MKNHSFREENAIVVEQATWDSAIYPGIIRSGILGPCIAIGIYDPTIKKGYMLHDPCISLSGLLPNFIKEAISSSSDISKLDLYATGAAYESRIPDVNVTLDENRQFAQEGLLRVFSNKQIEFNWADEDYITELFLDTKNGEFYTIPLPNNPDDVIEGYQQG